MMATVFVGVGSNIDPLQNVPSAIRLLYKRAHIATISTFYQTMPLGSPGSEPFYNGVIKTITDIPPHDLKYLVLRDIETQLGRIRTSDKYASRPIDFDILLYDNLVIDEPDLVIPDPDILTREFVASPLLEVAGDIIIPGCERRLSEVVKHMDTEQMVPLLDFTDLLRGEIMNEQGKS